MVHRAAVEQSTRFTAQEYSRSIATMKSSCVDARNNDQDILSAAPSKHRIDTLFLTERATNLRFTFLKKIFLVYCFSCGRFMLAVAVTAAAVFAAAMVKIFLLE